MKFLTTLFFILFTNMVFAQGIDSVHIQKDTILPLSIEFKKTKAQVLVDKTYRWASETDILKNAEEDSLQPSFTVRKSSDTVIIQGFKEYACWYKGLGRQIYYHMDYSMRIVCFKNRYHIYYTVDQLYTLEMQPTIFTYGNWFEKTGRVKKPYHLAVSTLSGQLTKMARKHNVYLIKELD